MADPTRAALEQAAHELDIAENALLCSSFHNAAIRAKQAAMTARAAIAADRAQRQPVPLVPGEVGDEARYLARELRDQADDMSPALELFGLMHRAADLLEQRHPTPVPVSERLPGPEDCDAEGRCWLRRKQQPGGPTWWLARPASLGTEALRIYYAEWLPAHALPLPGEVEE